MPHNSLHFFQQSFGHFCKSFGWNDVEKRNTFLHIVWGKHFFKAVCRVVERFAKFRTIRTVPIIDVIFVNQCEFFWIVMILLKRYDSKWYDNFSKRCDLGRCELRNKLSHIVLERCTRTYTSFRNDVHNLHYPQNISFHIYINVKSITRSFHLSNHSTVPN